MNKEEYQVAGYLFEDMEQSDRARRELKGIEQVNARLKDKKLSEMVEIYNDIVDKKFFKTPVGYEYLKGVQRKLKNSPSVKNNMLKPIPVTTSSVSNKNKDVQTKNQNVFLLKTLIFINVVLVLIIIAMFIISVNSRHNTDEETYKEQIENKYSSWEEDLNQRESILNKRENQ